MSPVPPPGFLARGDPQPPLTPPHPHHGAWMCHVNPGPAVPDILLCPSSLGVYFCRLRPLPIHPKLPTGHSWVPTQHPPPPPWPPWFHEDATGKGMVLSARALLPSFLPLLFLPALLCLFPPCLGMWPVSCPSSPGAGAKLPAAPKGGQPPQQQSLPCLPSQLPAPLAPKIQQRVLLPIPQTQLCSCPSWAPHHHPLVPKLPVPPGLPTDTPHPPAPLPAAPDATKATSCGTPLGLDMAPSPTRPLCTEDVPTGSTEEEEERRAEAEELQGAAEGWRKEPFGQEEPVLVGAQLSPPLPGGLRVCLGSMCPLLLPQPCLCSTHCPLLLLAPRPVQPLAHLGDTGTLVSPSQGHGSALLQLPPCLWPCGTLLPPGQGAPRLPMPWVGFLHLPQGPFPFPSCGAGGCSPLQRGTPCSAPQPKVPRHGVAKPSVGTGLYLLGKDIGRSKYECSVCAKSFGQLSNLKVPWGAPAPALPPLAWQCPPPAFLASARAGDKGQQGLSPAVRASRGPLPVPQFPPSKAPSSVTDPRWAADKPPCAPAVPCAILGAAGCSWGAVGKLGQPGLLGSLGAPHSPMPPPAGPPEGAQR